MRLLIADAHVLVRGTLAAFLHRESDIETVVVNGRGRALAEIEAQPAVDLTLLEHSTSGMNGFKLSGPTILPNMWTFY